MTYVVCMYMVGNGKDVAADNDEDDDDNDDSCYMPAVTLNIIIC